MAFRTRRRRSTQIWLPTYGNANDQESTDAVVGTAGVVPVAFDGTITVDGFPVTFDYTTSPWQEQFGPLAGGATLHDIAAGQEWKLLRAVGKVHLGYTGIWGGTDPTYVHPIAAEVAAGLIVLRTNEEGNAETDIDECNPLAQESADDPWIWRRKWILTSSVYAYFGEATPAVTPATVAGMYKSLARRWPSTNVEYGSVADGPHLDQKTRRRIGREERLFWMIATRMWDPEGALNAAGGMTSPGTIVYNIDNRFVGRLSSRMGNRNNASR